MREVAVDLEGDSGSAHATSAGTAHTGSARRWPSSSLRACSQSGIAGLPAGERTAYPARTGFRPRTSRTVTEPHSLRALLVRVRHDGYAMAGEELEGAGRAQSRTRRVRLCGLSSQLIAMSSM
ncbi:IclR family transcriptional regulator C-terminal domain-containing protein [Streptomyces sp. NPDC001549]|uniref:IclR family transcriptional regulator domain-containing protein n=1 Tax=Streptomyces sp. NPDC001549 TaxID=3364586 RepID=UPI0036C3A065